MPNIGPLIVSWIRTIIPTVVAAVVATLLSLGVELGTGERESVAAVAFLAITSAYYLGVRLLEEYVHPHFGALLGVPSRPTYNHPADAPPAE